MPNMQGTLTFIWLQKGAKYSSFDQHHQFLPLDHPFRKDKKNFTEGLIVTQPPPQMLTGAEVRAQVEALVANEGGGRYVGYGEQHMWSHKSGLQRLPYHDDLLVPQHIDFMHTEKNIAEALFCTLMDTNKSKDNPKARVDIATLCDRPNLEMRPPCGPTASRTTSLPPSFLFPRRYATLFLLRGPTRPLFLFFRAAQLPARPKPAPPAHAHPSSLSLSFGYRQVGTTCWIRPPSQASSPTRLHSQRRRPLPRISRASPSFKARHKGVLKPRIPFPHQFLPIPLHSSPPLLNVLKSPACHSH
jgi:hypothetical protein